MRNRARAIGKACLALLAHRPGFVPTGRDIQIQRGHRAAGLEDVLREGKELVEALLTGDAEEISEEVHDVAYCVHAALYRHWDVSLPARLGTATFFKVHARLVVMESLVGSRWHDSYADGGSNWKRRHKVRWAVDALYADHGLGPPLDEGRERVRRVVARELAAQLELLESSDSFSVVYFTRGGSIKTSPPCPIPPGADFYKLLASWIEEHWGSVYSIRAVIGTLNSTTKLEKA